MARRQGQKRKHKHDIYSTTQLKLAQNGIGYHNEKISVFPG